MVNAKKINYALLLFHVPMYFVLIKPYTITNSPTNYKQSLSSQLAVCFHKMTKGRLTSVIYFEQEWVGEFVWKCGFKLSASAKLEYVGRVGREGLSR